MRTRHNELGLKAGEEQSNKDREPRKQGIKIGIIKETGGEHESE